MTPHPVHPRMRGERGSVAPSRKRRYGSSPHARGTLGVSVVSLGQRRFIPACAGNAIWLVMPPPLPPGSSPHARGTRRYQALPKLPSRFIPACAGNARSPRSVETPRAVHPRMRGERLAFSRFSQGTAGSSPHARGTQIDHRTLAAQGRFILACAGNATWSPGWIPARTVHPRMRGERGRMFAREHEFLGSSPHARGTPRPQMMQGTRRRFIPACAGNAKTAPTQPRHGAVHPRMRGERRCAVAFARAGVGSSPHARGTLEASPAARFFPRFIPACAGNAATARICSCPEPVHPRMRGERSVVAMDVKLENGSSPHARGTPIRPAVLVGQPRFIPACAGNAGGARNAHRQRPVHPRMRGERSMDATEKQRENGSSPHARGTHLAEDDRADEDRFIPACAGNARKKGLLIFYLPVHPRMRGERRGRPCQESLGVGSSPHARGTPPRHPCDTHGHRFIPACAGNARAWTWAKRSHPVHPRMRGERPPDPSSLMNVAGSSPHARGTQDSGQFGGHAGRFIPACAGNAHWPTCSSRISAVHPRMRGERWTTRSSIF